MPSDALAYTCFPTPIGVCGIAWSRFGIRRVQLPEASAQETERRLLERFDAINEASPTVSVRKTISSIQRHFAKGDQDFTRVELDERDVPPFFRAIYSAARGVPAGTTISYGEAAARAGSPGASRAAGQALGKNPFPIVVPCHRVLAANRSAGGFSAYGGVQTKAKLLALEGVYIEDFEPINKKKALLHLRRADKRLARLIDSVGPCTLTPNAGASTFDALLRSIMYQQLNGRAASIIHARVNALFRRPATPSDILSAKDAALRSAGLSENKLRSLRDLAIKTVDGTVPSMQALRAMDEESIVECLMDVRGIGRWSAEMLLIFALGRRDILPVSDYGVRKGFATLLRKSDLPSPEELTSYAERWRPYRTVASWYLWRAVSNS